MSGFGAESSDQCRPERSCQEIQPEQFSAVSREEDERSYQPAINALCRPYFPLLVNMSLWGTLTGQKQSSSSSPSSSRDISPSPPPQYQTTTFDPNSAADVSSFLGDAALPDPSQLHPLAGLDRQTLDYLSLEESALSGKCAPFPLSCSYFSHD